MSLRPAGAKARVTVLVPAHNEEHSLPEAFRSLREQSRPPAAGMARADGACVHETHNKKADALNQVLGELLRVAAGQDVGGGRAGL